MMLLKDIVLIRPILILCIVIGHAFAIYTGSTSWPMPLGYNEIHVYSWINPVFISFQLQAFVFVSGYVFAFQEKIKIISTKVFIIKKIKRIIVPSICFGILYYYIIQYPETNKTGFDLVLYILNGVGHLWFLPMLFWCYVGMKIFYKYLKTPSIIVLGILLIISIFSSFFPDYLRLSTFLSYFVYFVLGAWIYRYKDYILKNYAYNKYIVILWLIVVVLCLIKVVVFYSCIEYRTLYLILNKILLGILGSVVLFLSVNAFLDKHTLCMNKLNWKGYMGVYIYHQFILKYFYYHTNVVLGNYWLPFCGLLITVVLSVLLVQLTLKFKWGRFLLG